MRTLLTGVGCSAFALYSWLGLVSCSERMNTMHVRAERLTSLCSQRLMTSAGNKVEIEQQIVAQAGQVDVKQMDLSTQNCVAEARGN